MKNIIKIIILFSLLLCNCHYQTKNDTDIDNGIDKQLLNIVDSLPLCDEIQNFVTFSFTTDSSYNLIIRVFNTLLIPIPPEPPEPYRNIIITETDWFVGYIKYKKWYILFDKLGINNKLSSFVKTDSLNRDEKPFIKNDIYNYDLRSAYRTCKGVEMVFSINEKDSLTLLSKKFFN
jgi:hypothetical protein